ncbi:MAG: aminopeptidase P family protein [Bryobacteraceae bacterium]|nr:aminopeptidase P family protein [Bryobacteraceae bacterium]
MSLIWRVAAAFLVCIPLFGAPRIEQSEYKTRREALRKEVGDSIVILFGKSEKDGGDLRSGFFQEANFYYLTGWNEPGAMLVLTPKSDVLLIPKRDAVQERWTGPKAAPGDPNISAVTGFSDVLPTEKFEASLPNWLQEGKAVYTLLESPAAENLKRALPVREIRGAAIPIARLRMKKSAAEIALIQYTTDVDIDAHKAAWQRTRPGLKEYEIASTMMSLYFSRGCERHSYTPIVGSGGNAAVLHYSKNTRQMDSGELLLMDVAPECSMYATDITRTIPVSGKFSTRQRELYEIVLGAQKAALAAVKPGVMLGGSRSKVGLHKIAADYIDSHGKDQHGKSLGQYFIHGLGHHVGLDVHDAVDPSLPLAAGMVITLEPGIYIPEEGIGIRIEDMVLVTENGGKLMSDALPRELADVEKAMAVR